MPSPSFDDLASRFETPERRNRWDSPLFCASPAGANFCFRLEMRVNGIDEMAEGRDKRNGEEGGHASGEIKICGCDPARAAG